MERNEIQEMTKTVNEVRTGLGCFTLFLFGLGFLAGVIVGVAIGLSVDFVI